MGINGLDSKEVGCTYIQLTSNVNGVAFTSVSEMLPYILQSLTWPGLTCVPLLALNSIHKIHAHFIPQVPFLSS